MSNFRDLYLSQATASTATDMVVPYSGVPGSQLLTDPDFNYDPTTQTLSVPVVSFGGLVLSGDIEFTNDVDHSILVLPSAAATNGHRLDNFAGDGGDATAGAVGGAGGTWSGNGGVGGDAGAAHAAGAGGPTRLFAGDGGAGSALQVAGVGGAVTVRGGSAGANGGGGGANGGAVTIDGGALSGGGTGGAVTIAGTNAGSLALGRTGITTTVNGTLAPQGNVTFAKEVNHSVTVGATTTNNTAGGNLAVAAGAGFGNGTGGTASLTGGAGGASGLGGPASVIAGAGATTGGTVSLAGGAGTSTNGGDAALTGGLGGTNGGAVSITGGAGTSTTGGSVSIDGGAGGVTPGSVSVGAVTANGVTLGRTGKFSTVAGNLRTSQGVYSDDTAVNAAASPYTALATDDKILCDATAGAITVNLPAIATVRNQTLFIVKTEAGASAVVIDPSGAETVGGAATLSLAGGSRASAQIYAPSTGTDWVIL